MTNHSLIQATKVLLLALVLSVGIQYAFAAWSGPTAAPPNNNVSAPVNVGSSDQVKNAGLSLNTLFVTFDSLFAGKVGIGSATLPTHTLEVTGTVQASGDVCTTASGSNVCLSTAGGSVPNGSTSLMGGVHTIAQCISGGGAPYNTGTGYICEFAGGSCATGWSQNAQWSLTNNTSCSAGVSICGIGSCTTTSHVFSNHVPESCSFSYGVVENDACGSYSGGCSANIVNIGCI